MTANLGSQSVQHARERTASRCGEPAYAALDLRNNNYRLWPAQRLRVAGRGLREGILLGLMDDYTDNQSDRFSAATGQSAAQSAD